MDGAFVKFHPVPERGGRKPACQPAPSSARTALLDWESQGKLIPALQQCASVPLEDAFSGYPCYLRGEKKKKRYVCIIKLILKGKSLTHIIHAVLRSHLSGFSLLQTLSPKQVINKSLGGNAPTQHIKSTVSPSTESHSIVVVSCL